MYQRDDHGLVAVGWRATAMPAPALGHGGADTVFPVRILRSPKKRLADLNIVVDLGSRIGSLQWFRGAASLTAMIGSLLYVAPPIRPLSAPGGAMLTPAQGEEMRALGIAPQAYGAGTGRRAAPTDRAEPLASAPERPQIELSATLGFGDGLTRVLEREGAGHVDAVQAAALIGEVVSLADIAAGTRLAIVLGRRSDDSATRPLDQLSFRARFDLSLAVRRVGGRLILERQPIAVDEAPLRLSGDVGGGLYHAARVAGAPPSAVADYIRAIARRIDIGQILPGDRFDMVMEHRRAATGETETGRLLFAGLVHAGTPIRLLRWTIEGREQWFDASGVGESRNGFTMPVDGHQTSGFGLRFHPLLGFTRMHQGIDYGAPYGSPIVAASDGVISFAGWHGGHGNFVQIRHAGGMGTGYGHMSSFVVRPGEPVQQGQLIGYVGSTGLSTGPHLHFEVYRDGQVIDPATASFATTSRIAGADLPRFRAAFARYTALTPKG